MNTRSTITNGSGSACDRDPAPGYMLQPTDDIQRLADQAFHCSIPVFGNRFLYPVGHDGAEAETMVAQDLAQAVDACRLHLEIGDPVGAVLKGCQLIDEVRMAESQAKHPALGAIE